MQVNAYEDFHKYPEICFKRMLYPSALFLSILGHMQQKFGGVWMGNSSESEVLQWLQDRASGPWCRIERWAGSLGRSLRFGMGVVLGQKNSPQTNSALG